MWIRQFRIKDFRGMKTRWSTSVRARRSSMPIADASWAALKLGPLKESRER